METGHATLLQRKAVWSGIADKVFQVAFTTEEPAFAELVATFLTSPPPQPLGAESVTCRFISAFGSNLVKQFTMRELRDPFMEQLGCYSHLLLMDVLDEADKHDFRNGNPDQEYCPAPIREDYHQRMETLGSLDSCHPWQFWDDKGRAVVGHDYDLASRVKRDENGRAILTIRVFHRGV